ncbi:hypothetical protein [Microbaculum marinum]|uniref:Uncharacterized protein n=1 Tax=Microbaculum marinum TaxID=1764581 RepID=A0AAW9RPD4_9HYPH
MNAALFDAMSAYGLQLALWLGWPCLLAGGLAGAAISPRWRITGIVAGATGGTLLWMASWLAVAVSLRLMGVAA